MSIHVSSNVWRSCPQRHDRLILLLALADFANDEGYCWPSNESLAHRCRCSERHIQRMIQSLIKDGDITRLREGRGRGNSSLYLLERYSEGGVLTTFVKGDIFDKKETIQAIKGDSSLGQSVPEPKKPINRTIIEAQIVNIYDAYPKKAARPAAFKAIKRALESVDAEKLLETTKLYAKTVNGCDPQFIPYPATWFNQERYNDNPIVWKPRDETHKRTNSEGGRRAGATSQKRTSDYATVGKIR
jgi:Helix-turn-helix domain